VLTDDQLAKLRDLLENETDWPSEYLFKFIVPSEKLGQIEALFPGHSVETRTSSKGKYVSCTICITLDSADHVIAIYQQASTIPGVFSL